MEKRLLKPKHTLTKYGHKLLFITTACSTSAVYIILRNKLKKSDIDLSLLNEKII